MDLRKAWGTVSMMRINILYQHKRMSNVPHKSTNMTLSEVKWFNLSNKHAKRNHVSSACFSNVSFFITYSESIIANVRTIIVLVIDHWFLQMQRISYKNWVAKVWLSYSQCMKVSVWENMSKTVSFRLMVLG